MIAVQLGKRTDLKDQKPGRRKARHGGGHLSYYQEFESGDGTASTIQKTLCQQQHQQPE